MQEEQGLAQILVAMKEQIALLGFSGLAGGLFSALMAPEERWKRRVIRGIAGALSAIFLGGILAHFIDTFTGLGPQSYLAAGFIMGTGGEVAVKAIQDRLLAK